MYTSVFTLPSTPRMTSMLGSETAGPARRSARAISIVPVKLARLHAERDDVTQLDDIAGAQPGGAGHSLPIDKGAVGRAEVLNHKPIRPRPDPGVLPGQRWLSNDDVVARAPANSLGAFLNGKHLARIGAALEKIYGGWLVTHK